MPAAVVVGTQWGDEGKGKIIDYLSEKADFVVRFCGGANAGHTIVYQGKKYAFHQLPSGVLYPAKKVAMGNGMVVDPKIVLSELEKLKQDGVTPELLISNRAHLVLPYHYELDGLQEEKKGKYKAGTTKKGIGPCYSDKAARFGIRVGDLLELDSLKNKMHTVHELKTKLLKEVYGKEFERSEDEVYQEFVGYAEKLKPFIADVGVELNDALDEGKKVLFEGAQGTMLCIDHGLYPYGTSSDTSAGGASTGTGVGPSKIDEVVGVVKVYTSRVGVGPVPTELFDETGDKIRERGHEFGTTTGRPRRIGWLDLVTLKHAARVNGLTGIAFTRVDTLASVPELKVCVAYELDGKEITRTPATPEEYARCKPVYKDFKGWEDVGEEKWREIAGKGFEALPKEAQEYLTFVAGFLKLPIYIVSVGPGREDTMVLKQVF